MATTEHSVQLARLPALADLSADEYRNTILEAVERRVASAEPVSEEASNSVEEAPDMLDLGEFEARTLYSLHGDTLKFEIPVGMETLKSWPPTYKISEVTPRKPLYLTRNTRLRRRFHHERWHRNLEYELASKSLRSDIGKPKFPRGMIPPHKTRPVGATRPPPLEARSVHLKMSA
ncbi:MAG: hypothetical protein ACQEVA_17120 [Myxococcota bacterium]